MKTNTSIVLATFALLTLNACKNEEITSNRGKVKFETISVSSKIGGRIDKIYVEEGQTVKKGDTLALMNVPEVNAKLMQAEGAITAAKGQLNMAFNGATVEQLNQIEGQLNSGKAQLEFAQESYNRLQNMYQDSLVSQQQFDEVKMKLNMAKAQVDTPCLMGIKPMVCILDSLFQNQIFMILKWAKYSWSLIRIPK